MKKTDGVPEEIERVLKNVPGIQYAFIHSSSVKNMENHGPEVDIIVLGGPDLVEMDEAVSKAEEKTGRPFFITSFTVREFRERIRVKDEAISRTLHGPKIMLIGDEEKMKISLSTPA